MKYTYEETKKKLRIELDEDIDMDSCRSLRTIVDGYIIRYSPSICELDMSKVKFIHQHDDERSILKPKNQTT